MISYARFSDVECLCSLHCGMIFWNLRVEYWYEVVAENWAACYVVVINEGGQFSSSSFWRHRFIGSRQMKRHLRQQDIEIGCD